MTRYRIFLALIALAGCDRPRAVIDDPENMVAWSQRNPSVDENTWKGVASLECRPTRADICKPGGCNSGKPLVWLVFEPATSTYKRCGSDGCDAYQAQVSYSGAFANVSVPDRAMFARITASGEFYEVVTQMDMVWIYRGQCQRMAGQK